MSSHVLCVLITVGLPKYSNCIMYATFTKLYMMCFTSIIICQGIQCISRLDSNPWNRLDSTGHTCAACFDALISYRSSVLWYLYVCLYLYLYVYMYLNLQNRIKQMCCMFWWRWRGQEIPTTSSYFTPGPDITAWSGWWWWWGAGGGWWRCLSTRLWLGSWWCENANLCVRNQTMRVYWQTGTSPLTWNNWC